MIEPIVPESKKEPKDKEVEYWEKALFESDQMLEKLKSSLKYETATNEMCRNKVKHAVKHAKTKSRRLAKRDS